MDLLKALKPIEEVEAELSLLYEWFSRQNHLDAEAGAFFARLSHDEKSHQQIVQYQRRIVARNTRIFEGVELDVDEITRTVQNVKSLMASPPPADLDAMIRITLEFENGTAEKYYRTAMTQANPEVGEFLQRLGLSSANHYKTVLEFAELRGILPPTPPKRTPEPVGK